jgi:tetratricopeptide (TPR) repeat protein
MIPTAALSSEEVSRLSLAQAKLIFQLHDRVSRFHEIDSAMSRISSGGAVTTTAAQFQAGLGVICCVDGDYLASVNHYENAYRIAIRLGNDTLRVAISANLALLHGRLGNYEKQLQCAEESLSTCRPDVADYNELLAAYSGAFASIFMGLPSKAREIMSKANSRVQHGLAPWALQAWLLYSADLLLLIGDEEASLAAASAATTGSNAKLHARDFAGVFSRWTANMAGRTSKTTEALDTLLTFFRTLESYDALDRAEIVASLLLLERRNGAGTYQLEALLTRLLDVLPTSVKHQMKCLRMLN